MSSSGSTLKQQKKVNYYFGEKPVNLALKEGTYFQHGRRVSSENRSEREGHLSLIASAKLKINKIQIFKTKQRRKLHSFQLQKLQQVLVIF